MLNNNFRKMCYDLYVIDWKRSHMITPEIEMDTIKDYYGELTDSHEVYTYNEYINEFGYGGMCFVCFDEFIESEYTDPTYMCRLIDNPDLICIYLQDLKKITDNQ